MALILLGGISLISVIAFFTHNNDVVEDTDLLLKRQAKAQQMWTLCVENVPADAPEGACGTEPDRATLESFARIDERYKGYEGLAIAVIGVGIAAAGVAFFMGASSGGAEWSSRSMTLQLLFEPRRLRLLTIKWLALVISARSSGPGCPRRRPQPRRHHSVRPRHLGPAFAPVPQLENSFGSELALMGGRALILVVIAATIGYAIAMLVRNTGASLGVAFVYFVVIENVVRFALMKYGTEPFMFSDNAVAYIFPGGIPVPGKREAGELSFQSEIVQLTNLRSFITLTVYTALLALPAAWSFTRRDVG